jgi:hypothetical protein
MGWSEIAETAWKEQSSGLKADLALTDRGTGLILGESRNKKWGFF